MPCHASQCRRLIRQSIHWITERFRFQCIYPSHLIAARCPNRKHGYSIIPHPPPPPPVLLPSLNQQQQQQNVHNADNHSLMDGHMESRLATCSNPPIKHKSANVYERKYLAKIVSSGCSQIAEDTNSTLHCTILISWKEIRIQVSYWRTTPGWQIDTDYFYFDFFFLFLDCIFNYYWPTKTTNLSFVSQNLLPVNEGNSHFNSPTKIQLILQRTTKKSGY